MNGGRRRTGSDFPAPANRAQRVLPRKFYDRDPRDVARDLLGKRLVSDMAEGRVAGRLVEVEAYLGRSDSASHSYAGPTPRNVAMFGPPGHAYVYAIHARWCLNAVTEPEGEPTAVLLRAVEPLEGIELMRRRRGQVAQRDLTNGPAKLCAAFGIDKSLNHWDLTRGQVLWIEDDPAWGGYDTTTSPRIGVTSARDLPLRYFVDGNPFVSGPRRHHRRPVE